MSPSSADPYQVAKAVASSGMTTVVFVHGTGVRKDSYEATYARVVAGLIGVAVVARCYWGDEHGARLAQDGACIPDIDTGRGIGEPEDDLGPWAILNLDPYYELRLLAFERGHQPGLPPGAVPPSRRLREAALLVPSDEEVQRSATAAGLSDTLAAAVESVMDMPTTRDALTNAAGDPVDVATALARAFVAEAMVQADAADGGERPVAGPGRDTLVAAIVAQLDGDTRGVGGRWALAGARVVYELTAATKVERKRAVLTKAVTPTAGDIMLYLARGAGLRRFIADTVAGIDDGVVLLGHSLGGIACVDLLLEPALPNVQALITVGSQVPLLQEMGALPGLEPGAALPGTFPLPWINVYDRRDLLSFLAEPVFGERVRDYEVDSRMPFPRSHSAYFANPAFYAIVGSVVAAVDGK